MIRSYTRTEVVTTDGSCCCGAGTGTICYFGRCVERYTDIWPDSDSPFSGWCESGYDPSPVLTPYTYPDPVPPPPWPGGFYLWCTVLEDTVASYFSPGSIGLQGVSFPVLTGLSSFQLIFDVRPDNSNPGPGFTSCYSSIFRAIEMRGYLRCRCDPDAPGTAKILPALSYWLGSYSPFGWTGFGPGTGYVTFEDELSEVLSADYSWETFSVECRLNATLGAPGQYLRVLFTL